MDPSIMKLLEEDEDEHMHSGADIEALTAALNRDIGGAPILTAPVSAPDSDMGQPPPAPSLAKWPQSVEEEDHAKQQMQMQEVHQKQQIQEHEMDQLKHAGCPQHLQDKSDVNSLEDDHPLSGYKQVQAQDQSRQLDESQHQHPENSQCPGKILGQGSEKEGLQNTQQYPLSSHAQLETSAFSDSQPHCLSTQHPSVRGQINSSTQQPKQSSISFAHLIPMMLPHLDKDRAMQLSTIFTRLRKNEVSKEDFLRVARGIVGDQMLRKAVQMLQEKQHMQMQSRALRNAQSGQQKYPFPCSDSPQQSSNSGYNRQQISESQSLSNLQQLTQNASQQSPHDHPSQLTNSGMQMQKNSSPAMPETSAQNFGQNGDHNHDVQGISSSQVSSVNKSLITEEGGESSKMLPSVDSQQKQQHMQFPQTPFSTYGSTVANYYSYGFPMSSVNAQAAPKLQGQDSLVKAMTHAQGLTSSQLPSGQLMNTQKIPKHDMPNRRNEAKRLQGGSHPQIPSMAAFQPTPSIWQTAPEKYGKSSGVSTASHVKQDHATGRAVDQPEKLLLPTPGSSYNPMNIGSGKAGHGLIRDETMEKQPGGVTTNQFPSALPAQFEPAMQVSSTPIPINANTSTKTPSKKSSAGQKKPLEHVASPTQVSGQLCSKKQKTSGEYQDQSIEQLNDVTAVSGVNLREEEEQLLSAPKEESRASEAMRRVVQEEEERLILQRGPLQRKLAQIMARSGIKNASSDVNHCLSICVEERLRGLISKLIRISKQRADVEKGRHKVVVTSDVRRQILLINRKAKEELDRKQAEEAEKLTTTTTTTKPFPTLVKSMNLISCRMVSFQHFSGRPLQEAEKLRKQNEAEGNAAADAEKDEDRIKSIKSQANKEEDDKMRATAANVAARAAVGGDDMLSKWQLMAEQARQKRDGGVDGASGYSASKDVSRKTLGISTKAVNNLDNQTDVRPSPGASYGGVKSFGRSPILMAQAKVARAISIKDLISLLEKEPQMAKSTLLYRLYEWSQSDASEKASEAS